VNVRRDTHTDRIREGRAEPITLTKDWNGQAAVDYSEEHWRLGDSHGRGIGADDVLHSIQSGGETDGPFRLREHIDQGLREKPMAPDWVFIGRLVQARCCHHQATTSLESIRVEGQPPARRPSIKDTSGSTTAEATIENANHGSSARLPEIASKVAHRDRRRFVGSECSIVCDETMIVSSVTGEDKDCKVVRTCQFQGLGYRIPDARGSGLPIHDELRVLIPQSIGKQCP
jgi:hypothetical protein